MESVEYVEKTEANPDGIRWEARDIASPGLSDRNRSFHRMVCLNKAGQNATAYWWKIWTTERIGNTDRRVLKTMYGIRFHNDPDKIVYPYMLVSSVLMDKKYPGLKDFCKNGSKGPKGKSIKKRPRRTMHGYSICMMHICKISKNRIQPYTTTRSYA